MDTAGRLRLLASMSPSARPLVSVVLPVRNAGGTIGRAIASIRAQTLHAWELVAVDDGSTDGTGKQLAEIARSEPRLRVVSRPAEGLVPALNAGLAAAQAPLVARMDADDEAHPRRLEAQAAWLAEAAGRDLGLVGSLVAFGGDAAASAGYALHVEWINSLVTPEAIALNRFVESPLAHPSVMFRRELVARHGGYCAGDFPEDYELWLRWLDAGVRMAKVPEVLLTWHDGQARLSRTDMRYDPAAFYRTKARWLARELERIGAGREIWVWGAGRPTRKRAAELAAHGVRLAGYIDVDAKKTTPALGGSGPPVIGPAGLPEPGRCLVLGYVASRGARELIRAALRARGYAEGRDFLMCA